LRGAKSAIEAEFLDPDSEKEKKVKNFQYAHFRIPMYKHPFSSLVGLCIPIWVLAVINLCIYYQVSNDLASKIGAIGTVTLSFVAFVPTVNEKIPQTSVVKLVEIIIYVQIATTFLTLYDAMVNRHMDPTVYETVWTSNVCFLITISINLLCGAIVVLLFLVHKIWWEYVYTKKRPSKLTGKLLREPWENS
jgi:hypothetical protein